MTFPPRFAALRIPIVWFVLAVSAQATEGAPQDSTASASNTAQDQSQTPGVPPGGAPKFSRFHRVLGRNLTSNLFTRNNLTPFLIGAAGALAIAPVDQEISQALRGHASGFGDAGQEVGGIAIASIVGGSLVASRLTKDNHFQSFSYTLAQAYATNVILTQGIKHATHRMRPDGSASTSLPSGHASDAFALATVVTGYYGKKWGIPLYVVATLIGVSRIEHGRHWPSDVVAGAALGYIAGRTAIRGTKRELAGGKTSSGWMVVPVVGRDRRGVLVRFSY